MSTQNPSEFHGTVVPQGERKNQRATLSVEGGSVVATTEQDVRYTIAFANLKLDLGGHNNSFLYCKVREGEGPSFATEDKRLVRVLRGLEDPALVAALSDIEGQKTRDTAFKLSYWGCLVGLVVGTGIFALVLLALTPAILSFLLGLVPIEVDQMLGEAAYEDMDMGEVVTDPRIVAVVDEMVQRIGAESEVEGFDFRVDVIKSDDVNAFALPGGQMMVCTGLLESAESPDQVAGVIGHEIAHVTRRHGMRQVATQAGLGIVVFLVLGDISGWLVLAGEAAAVVASNSYSRSQESDADEEGARLLAAAGLDPKGLVAFFEMLKDVPGSEMPDELNWLSTHPEHQERIDHINEIMPDLPRGRAKPLKADWDAMKQALDEL